VPGDAAGPYLVDGGFGGHLINVPLRLDAELVQASAASQLRLTKPSDAFFTLESKLPEGWSPIYRFALEPQLPADYEPLNWFTATHPASIFRHNLLMERLTPTLRANLLNDRLTLRAVGRAPEVRRIAEAAEFGQLLTELFGLRLPVPAAELFDQVPRGGDAPVVPATS